MSPLLNNFRVTASRDSVDVTIINENLLGSGIIGKNSTFILFYKEGMKILYSRRSNLNFVLLFLIYVPLKFH